MDVHKRVMARNHAIAGTEERRARGSRLGFRVDSKTKALVERAARLERRSLTDFCSSALDGAAQQVVQRHAALSLSERDRAVFFDTLIKPPKPNARLRRAVRAARARIEP